MNRRHALNVLNTVGVATVLGGSPPEEDSSQWVKRFSGGFAMLYYMGDVKSADEMRMVPELDIFSGKPTGRDVQRPFSGVIRSGFIDVAELIARAENRVRLSQIEFESVAQALMSEKQDNLKAMCYTPHHVIVHYSNEGSPDGALEVCLECSAWKALPAVEHTGPGNLLEVAKVFDRHKIPLGPLYPTLSAFETAWKLSHRSPK